VSDPREVTITLAECRSLTVLEVARACSLAGVRQSDVRSLMRSLGSGDTPPEHLERAVTLLYAMAFELRLRDEHELTWDDAQRWRVTLDLDAIDELADAEATAVVEAAIATGLPPREAGELTVAQLDAYREVGERVRVARGRGG
jgi:hypothetical protein